MRAGRRGNDPQNHEQVGRIHCYLPTHPPTRHDEGRNQSPAAHLVHPVRSAVTRAQLSMQLGAVAQPQQQHFNTTATSSRGQNSSTSTPVQH